MSLVSQYSGPNKAIIEVNGMEGVHDFGEVILVGSGVYIYEFSLINKY